MAAPILFLDFDGVLHPGKAHLIDGKVVLKQADVGLFAWAEILEELLAPHPAVQIMLSTSWVEVFGLDDARDFLPDALSRRVIGATWTKRVRNEWKRCSRFEQIRRAAFREKIDRWIAVDDDVRDWPASWAERLVAADSDLGLSAQATQDALRDRLAWLTRPTLAEILLQIPPDAPPVDEWDCGPDVGRERKD